MYPYTKELTLDEALKLKAIAYDRKINILTYFPKYLISQGVLLTDEAVDFIYSKNEVIKCDALTYATHILNQQAPPEGWGYAAYELDSGRYYGLEYGVCSASGWDVTTNPSVKLNNELLYDWHIVAFKLTDLAIVEAETDAASLAPSGIKPPLNCCPKCDETHQELTAKVADWEAKNKELANLGLTYAVDIANSDKYKERIAELEAKLDTTQKVCKSLLGQVERAKAYLEAVETKLSLIEKLEANKPKLEKAQVEYYRPKGYYSE